ncbi:dynein heavy chain 12, axonemal isoform X2 [Hippocampus comes]|uniref:dynein heavy chain 12, axonemal isoform X2 n=1 Tax=Hippocampus comes TaxID=109280 RepID=UPI00094EB672|nr:PREDICTED: dynein heavy chain 12, axonemal-like isoform X2 [Hippocampus comes]
MNTEAKEAIFQSEDDSDQDETTQSIIEESLIEYRKLKGLNPSHLKVTEDPDDIFKAIAEGDEGAVKRLMEQPEALSKVNEHGWIPLHAAAVQESKHILKIIFSASPFGAAQCRTFKGETPLFLAVVYGRRHNSTFLLQNGCNPNLQDDEQDSPLMAGSSCISIKMSIFLHFDVSVAPYFSAILNDQYDLATLLLHYDAQVDQLGPLSRTALHEAAFLGLENFVYLLLESGANPNACDIMKKTPLALATQNGHLNVAEHLLLKGANVECESESGSILFEAATSGNPDVISLLLDHGADANLPSYSGHLPIHCAAYHGHILALQRLIPVTKLCAIKESGMSPLHSAAAGGHAHCLEVLLKADFDPNQMLHPRMRRNYDDERKSALFFAVSNNDLQCTRLLLEAGAMMNQDPYALKDEVMLRMILNHGYDVKRCFDCPYGDSCHDLAPWTTSVIKDMVFCEMITVSWLKQLSAQVVRIMLDYTNHVSFCAKLREVLQEQKQWPQICHIQRNARSLKHLCRLKIREHLNGLRLKAPVFITYLPLPPMLKEYLRYKEFDVYHRGSTDTVCSVMS